GTRYPLENGLKPAIVIVRMKIMGTRYQYLGGNNMYSEKVMDHFSNPRNMGEIEGANGVGTVGNARCGDIMRMYLDIDENGIIQDVKFKTFGCGAAVATSSMATDLVKGRTIEEALQVSNKS